MSAFKVGQRVRIVFSYRNPQWVGKEATICKVDPYCRWEDGSNGVGYALAEFSSEEFSSWAPEFLEPLTNPGQESIIASIQKMPGAEWSIPAPGVAA